MALRPLFRKTWRFCKRLFLWMFITSLVYMILTRWVMPPVTLTQISNGLFLGYGLHRDYVTWENISYNVKLAAIASEDQSFPDHGGFDWDAIEQSLHPKKKGKKSRIPLGGGASTISQQTAKNVFLWQGGGFTRYIRKVPEM
ncbi:MAG TPA: transglycosylase domain-containing protein, partial [Sediminibacterium sp.]|nr:transglycosylase domain-containing protein [Sediminibacterium sp.]